MQPTPSSSQQALEQLTAYRAGVKDPQTILAEARGKYGVDTVNSRIQALRGAITNTEQLLGGVDNSVTGRTQGTLTTEAARSRLVNLERQPIAETLATQQSGLSNEQANLQDITGQASNEAQLIYGGQQDQLSYLKSIYDTLFGKEQEQEKIRQFNENLALERQKAADSARAALAAIAAQRQNTPAPTAPVDPLYQIAYDDVRTRVAQLDDNALKSDYNATALSAGYGNPKDKLKLQIYKSLRPDIFANYTPPAPTPKQQTQGKPSVFNDKNPARAGFVPFGLPTGPVI